MAQLKSTNITGNLSVTGNVLASKIIILGGTADEILCADGSTTTLSGLGAGTVTSVGISNGGGLSVTGSPITGAGAITISHADTSTANNLTANGRRYVTGLTFDTYGHVTGYTTGTESVTDTDTGATSVDVTGKGNAITSASYDSTTRKITFTKGATFLTTHQSLSGYLKGSGTTGVIPKFTASNTVGDSNLSLHSSGALQITANSNTITIGSQNASFCHIYNSANIPFIFNQGLQVTGNKDLGTSQYDWKDLYLSGSIKKVKSTSDNTTYTLTLPNKTGTIALTSDLSSFITSVPEITITDTTSATTHPIIGGITASEHTITVSRKSLSDLGLASAYKYIGSVDKYENLPTSGQTVGDVYNVTETGMNYAWNRTAWDALGSTVDLSNYATKTDLASYLPLAGNTNTTLMTGPIKYGGKTQEIISIASEYQSGSWKGGMKYSWDSKTTLALWGKNADCQFVWHAGADFSTGSTDGWTNRNYDFQVGRNSSSTLEALLGGKPLATQEWVTNQLGSGGDFNLSNYVTLNTPQTIDGVKTFTAQPVISTASGLKFANGNCTLKIYNTSASPTDYAAIEVRSNSASTNRNLFIDLANNSLVIGAASGTPDTTYKVNVKDTFNATTIYENGTALSSKYLGINDKAADSSKLDGKTPETTLTTNSDAVIPTSKAIATYVTNLLEDLELGDNYQPKDTDLTAIAGLGDDTVTGLLRKKGKNSWEIDSNTYLKPGSNASANYLAFFKDGDEVSGSQNTHCDGVGNIKAASYGIYTDVANNKTATWQYNSSTDCVELVW